MRRKILNSSLIILQSIFLLFFFIPDFHTTDTENSDMGASFWNLAFGSIKTGYGIAAMILIAGFIAAALVIIFIKAMNSNKKYISSAAAIFVSILSTVFFYYTATDGYCGEYYIDPSFYVIVGTEVIGIALCLFGYFTRQKQE